MAIHQRTIMSLLLAFAAFASLISAQGVLTSGNSQLPSCATSCQSLVEAAAACGGATGSNPTIWNCFCQSAYLKGLYTSPDGVCDTYCTAAADNQAVMSWYTSNCGTDNGASEHGGSGAAGGATTTTTAPAGAQTSASSTTSSAQSATASSASTSNAESNNGGTSTSDSNKSWISTHYKWIIMLVVLLIAFALIIVLAIWLKRRHERKQDMISGGFNAGVSERGPPPMMSTAFNSSGQVAGPGSGRDSPARTRDAFMPYGYNYSRSDTRLAPQHAGMPDSHRRSPLARGGTPVDEYYSDGDSAQQHARFGAYAGPASAAAAAADKRGKRVLVQERNAHGPWTPPA